MERNCPYCGSVIGATAKFCRSCGKKIEEISEVFCEECGARWPAGCTFCEECGATLATGSTPADAWGDTLASLNAREEEAKLAIFEYEKLPDGSVVIKGLKNKYAVTVDIPAGVSAIAEEAFAETNVISVKIPEGVMTIERRAFFNCNNLTSLSLPSSLMIIGDEAFAECERLELEISDSVAIVGEGVLRSTKTERLKLEAKEREMAEAKRLEAERLVREKEEEEARKLAEREALYEDILRRSSRPGSTLPFTYAKEMIEWLRAKPDEDREAKLLLARYYIEGVGTAKNLDLARYILIPMHEKGFTDATAYLGLINYRSRDREAAKTGYDLARRSEGPGKAIAYMLLADYLYDTVPSYYDQSERISCASNAKKLGNIRAYAFGKTFRNLTDREWLNEIKEGYDKGYYDDPYLTWAYAVAHYNLTRDDVAALENVRKSADLGYDDAVQLLIITLLASHINTSNIKLSFGDPITFEENAPLGMELLEKYAGLGSWYAKYWIEKLKEDGKYEELLALCNGAN